MWHYSDAGQRLRLITSPPVPASVYDVLVGLRGLACQLIFLDLTTPDSPVRTLPGFLDEVAPSRLVVGLPAPPADLPPTARVRVEVLTGGALVRFHTQPSGPSLRPGTCLELTLPNQIETIQRRRFTRVPLHVPVAFSGAADVGSFTGGGVGYSLDISLGGIRFETKVPLVKGQRLYLSCQIPDGTHLRGLPGQVVRVLGPDPQLKVAVRFQGLVAEQEELLAQSVLKLSVQTSLRR